MGSGQVLGASALGQCDWNYAESLRDPELKLQARMAKPAPKPIDPCNILFEKLRLASGGWFMTYPDGTVRTLDEFLAAIQAEA